MTAPTIHAPTPTSRTVLGNALGLAALIAVWGFFSARRSELVLPSPNEAASALFDLMIDGRAVDAVGTTLVRAADGVLLALVIGIIWGSLSGLSGWFASISQPSLSTLMALPPVVIVAVGLVWLGPGGSTTLLVITLVALPLIVVAVQEAVRGIDHDLLEMAVVFDLSRPATLRHVVGPAIASPVLAATSVSMGQSLRVAVMAELLSAADGVGAEVARARTNLETADLFAWAIMLVAVVILLELTVLHPLTNHILRWRTPPT